MNEMRKLMESLNRIEEVGDDNSPVDGETFNAGGVRITIWDTEVALNNGHGQNIWLRRSEWQDFVDGITGQGLREDTDTGQQKQAFLDGWDWALATPWEDQLKSEEAYEKYVAGEDKPERY